MKCYGDENVSHSNELIRILYMYYDSDDVRLRKLFLFIMTSKHHRYKMLKKKTEKVWQEESLHALRLKQFLFKSLKYTVVCAIQIK